jgi:hypothetical protein
MRTFVLILLAVAASYFLDAEYNQGKFFDGLQRMGRSMSHSLGL